jgi:hypothetical protein
MNHPDTTEHQGQRAEELVSWTGRERLRFLWYRLRLTVSEMNYATRRMVELQMRLPDEIADRSATRAERDNMSDLALQCQSKLRVQIFGVPRVLPCP